MNQKLLLPLTVCKVVAGYKVEPYHRYWGYHHYGVDYKAVGELDVLSSGDGEVVSVGFDQAVGNTVCIIYKEAYNHKTGKIHDLVVRYMHLESIAVIAGQIVKTGDKLGVEGNTGSGKWDAHLHIEFDADTAWPNYSPQVAGSNFIKKSPPGYPDTTINPSQFLYLGEKQVIANGGLTGWTTSADWILPKVGDEPEPSLENRLSILSQQKSEIEEKFAMAKSDIAALAVKWK